ncbi:IclR family transcriptional regulator [Streptomyces shenzhenensis]|uniref:IclR family transcriptional regulator n=1 Tax=Streptomyces shenzhenensis TaxID=943815 RepID=UPI00369F3914
MTAIDKAFDLLDIVAEAQRPLGLTEIVNASGLPKPTVRRLLVGLLGQSFVMQNAQGKYEFGNAAVDLAARTLGGMTLAEESRPTLSGLRAHVTGTISLNRFSDHRLTTIIQIDASTSAFLVSSSSSAPLYATAAGKAVLAFMPRPDMERLVSYEMDPVTSRTLTNREDLAKELEVVRTRGFAFEDEEAQDGVRAVAVPVRTFAHRPIGAVSVASAAKLVSIPELGRMAPYLVAAADEISARLGGDPVSEGKARRA